MNICCETLNMLRERVRLCYEVLLRAEYGTPTFEIAKCEYEDIKNELKRYEKFNLYR